MRQSQLFTKTLKQKPKEEKSTNAILLQRAGFVYKEMAGVYSFLPLGLKVLRKVENIIREEMKKIDSQEVALSILSPKELWQKTGRWAKGLGKEVMYKCEGVGLGPTHEEMLTDIVSNHVNSYEDLPISIFQIQTKFRKEPRARSGVLRGREFGMKDMYSFHASEKDFKQYYEKAKQAYLNVFKRCGLNAIITEAAGGDFTDEFTHEFQVLAKDGEDTIIHCPKLHFSRNKEIKRFKQGDKCPICKGILKQSKSIEVGNTFPLGTKYSEALGLLFQDETGRKRPVIMGSYGIGTTRLVGSIVEVFHDEKGIIWPDQVAPFDVHLIALNVDADKIYSDLQKSELDVIYDDRKENTAGEKFADADLIGIPNRIVVSDKTLKQNSVEWKKRDSHQAKLIKIDKLCSTKF